MKAFHFAIASIVDANTGYAIQRDVSANNYATEINAGPRIPAKSVIALLSSIGRGLAAIPAALRDYQERKRKIREVVTLTDRELDDIGLNRGDALALEHGTIDLSQLGVRRIENLGNKRVQLYRGKRRQRHVSDQALNDAVFSRAKCA